jgi:epoxyqueuosine reductase
MDSVSSQSTNFCELGESIRRWGHELGFDAIGISDIDLANDEKHLQQWLKAGRQGQMDYMARHGNKRARPEELVAGTLRIISTRTDYLPEALDRSASALSNPEIGYISRYALGRDYHKLIRKRLQALADRITDEIGEFGYRAFTDSAPVLEKAIAQKAGLGWIGKHTNLIHKEHSSWFFLGELYTDLPLPIDNTASNHCGSCTQCISACPTGAIIAPYQLDARLCISYLTIELRGSIPLELRSMIGNRIYGCDDCQLVCPWNKYAKLSSEKDFSPRSSITDRQLPELFAWSEEQFLLYTEGSAIRRIGHECWLRNIAVALGNAPTSLEVKNALLSRLGHPSEMVREHVSWAIEQHRFDILNNDKQDHKRTEPEERE